MLERECSGSGALNEKRCQGLSQCWFLCNFNFNFKAINGKCLQFTSTFPTKCGSDEALTRNPVVDV